MSVSVLRFDRRSFSPVLAATLLAASLAALADARLPTATLKIGSQALKVEVAASDAQRERGLMFRKAMPRDEGMLFVFDDPGYYAMWMKNTLIPLSVAFVDRDGNILNIADMEPQTLDSHLANGPALYAIETNKGWFEAHKVHAGDKVTGLPKH
ncbi:MAG TPA: DUF192 domain-containing protein [Usitatibacter sp.]|nr:DUF192 domain-containing protein [Usitatibacter sp.]